MTIKSVSPKHLLLAAAIFSGVLGVCIVQQPSNPQNVPGLPGSSTAGPQPASEPRLNAAPETASAAAPTDRPLGSAQAGSPDPEIIQPIIGPGNTVRVDGREYPRRTYKPLAIPNDPSAAQWWVAQAKLNQAWDIPAGTNQTVLAIIDSGMALNHEEFAGRWEENAGEKGAAASEAASTLNCTGRSLAISAGCNLIDDDNDGVVDEETGPATYENPSRPNCTAQGRPLDKSCNRIDDDGNGYTDDLLGWDFINYDNAPQAGELNPNGSGTTHGTRVAGVAAATGNNAKGIAGVDWQAKILPIQALDDDSYGDTLSVGRSIYYAIARGADVISLSLGSDSSDEYVRGAVQAALAQGIVVVAASGNDGCDCIVYPANYPEVLAVGALNASSQPAGFSSYGANLDILAPGTGMTSASWEPGNQSSAYASNVNGTSFATPLVAGLLTRIKSQQPAATPRQLIAALTENTNRLSLAATTPHNAQYGFGTADAHKASARMATPKSTATPYAFNGISFGSALNRNAPAEPAGNAYLYACDSGTVGTTRIMELTKGASRLFTTSNAEAYQATQAGYSSATFIYGCIRQPHDPGTVMHSLNVYAEFRNEMPAR